MTPTKLMVRQAEVDARLSGSRGRACPLYEVELQAKAADARKRPHGPRAAFRRSMPSTLRDGSIYVDHAYVCRLLPLTCLAPDIVEAILAGRQPKGLRLAEMLGNGPLA
jgi:hypothetical protein